MSIFSKKEAIRFGWIVTKQYLGFLIGVVFLWFIIPAILQLIGGELNRVGNAFKITALIFILLGWVLNILISLGLVKISLKLIDNEKGRMRDLFNSYYLFFKYLLATALYVLIVLLGFLLLIVPGIIWSIKYSFYTYFIIDKGLGPIESLKQSAVITSRVKWNLFFFYLIMIGVNILGALVLMVGLLVTIPITLISYAYVYRKLLTLVTINQSVTPANLVAPLQSKN